MKFNEEILSAPTGNGDGASYLKLKDKETVTGIFRGDISVFYQLWPQGGTKQRFSEPTAGASMRFKVNFVVKDGSNFVPKVFEGGIAVYRQLAALHEEYDLQKTVFKITRNGLEKATTYVFMPAKASPSAETLKYLDTLDLIPVSDAPQAPAAAKPPVKNHAPGASNDEDAF